MKNKTQILFVTLLSVALISATASAQERPTKTESFTVSKGGTLEVSVDEGDIHIKTWGKDEVSVTAKLL
ncbi:MAG: hypothetical protein O7D34_12100, partial [Ignavibacteria bacterium]|nr:hypothetical protein [Ignavibacteria bacterium]